MGLALGSDCRDLVVPIVVTQGHLFGFTSLFGLFFFFFYLGDVVFPRYWTSLSQLPLSSAKMLPLTSLPLIGHRDPGCPTRCLLLQLSLPTARTVFSCLGWLSSPGFLLILTVHILIRGGAARRTWSGGSGVQ